MSNHDHIPTLAADPVEALAQVLGTCDAIDDRVGSDWCVGDAIDWIADIIAETNGLDARHLAERIQDVRDSADVERWI